MQLIKNSFKTAAGLAFALASTTSAVQAQDTATIRLNGQLLSTSVPPIVRNGSTLVPMRDIFEALDATVVWNPRTQAIKAQKDSTEIWLQIGNRTARIDGDEKILNQVPILYRQNTLVPLRFVSEALGAKVNWNPARRVVRINTNDRVVSRVERRNARRIDDRDDNIQQEVAGTVTVPSGAVVPVTLDDTLSSRTARVGETFTATVVSERPGDSEFPTGTVLRGRISEVRAKGNGTPGVLGLQFRQAVLPDGRTVTVSGDLISLDDESVTSTTDGRIMARPGKGGTDVKIIGIGAAAGYVLGKVLDKNEVITGIIGAAGGYLYDRSRDKGREQEAVVEAGTKLGVRLTQSVTYADASYFEQRTQYMN